MTESLHTQLVSVLNAADIHPALSEDEIDSYPYVTFELPVEYRYTKDGPYKIVGNLTIRSVSDDFDEADALRAGIESAIAQSFGGPANAAPAEDAEEEEISEVMPEDPTEETDPTEEPADPGVDPGENLEPEHAEDAVYHEYDDLTFSARITDVRKDCMDGVWVIELDFTLNQYE